MREATLFHEALMRTDPRERARFLDQACGEDAALRAAVESLIAAHEAPGEFLDRPILADDAIDDGKGPTGNSGPVESQATTVAESANSAGPPVGGRYKLMERIGEGGMGEVWAAKQLEPIRRAVALKVIKPGLESRGVLNRFEQERQALAVLDHPNIAKVLDAGTLDSAALAETGAIHRGLIGRPFFVMELIKGVPITEYCDATRLSPRERIELFVPVCHAVQHAHQKGIIHRDLKPSNILVGLYDGKPVPKVIDFGVAKAAGVRLTDESVYTELGSLIGTLEYMSPEQAELDNLDIDTRSDIYALGAVLYELLTGSVPFSRQDLQAAAVIEMLRMIREVDPPKPSTRLSASLALPNVAAVRHTEPKKLIALVRGELDWVILKCLEKDRGRRYQTANALASDLERFLVDEVVTARPPGAGYRFRKFLRRNRRPVLAFATILLALVGGVVGASIGLVQAVRARQEEAKRAEGELNAKLIAERRLAQIEKSNELLGAVFSNLDPRNEGKESDDLRLVLGKRLIEASKQLEAESVGDPLTVARMQRILGKSLFGLGHLDEAILLLKKARTALIENLGSDHEEALGAADNLALAYRTAGKAELALPLAEETLARWQALRGPRDLYTLNSLGLLAACYRSIGRVDRAIPLFEESLRLRRELVGTNDSQTLTTMNNLGLAYNEAGKPQRAIPILEEALKIRRTLGESDQVSSLSLLHNLAMAYWWAGKLDQALPRLAEVHELTKAKLGPSHHNSIRTMATLGNAYLSAAKPELALPLLEEAGAAIEKRRFQIEGAGSMIGYLAHCLETMQRQQQAEVWRKKWLAFCKEKGDSQSSSYAAELAKLAANLMWQQKWAEAEPVLRECLTIRQRLEPDAWTTFDAQSLFGGALFRLQKYDEAVVQLEEGYAGLKNRVSSIPPESRIRLTQAGDRLLLLHEARGYHARLDSLRRDVEKVRREQLPALRQKLGTDSPAYAAELALLGLNLLQQRNWVAAEPILRESLAIRQRNIPNDWKTFNTQSMLGAAMLGQGNHTDAEPLLLTGYQGMKERRASMSPQDRRRITEALARLIGLYEAWNKPDELKKWRNEEQTWSEIQEKGADPNKL